MSSVLGSHIFVSISKFDFNEKLPVVCNIAGFCDRAKILYANWFHTYFFSVGITVEY